MLGMIGYYRRNKILYELLDSRRGLTDESAMSGKRLIVDIDGRKMDTELRMNELCFLNAPVIGYAVTWDEKIGLCLLIDRYEKDEQTAVHPFEDGKVTIEARDKNKNRIITFVIE